MAQELKITLTASFTKATVSASFGNTTQIPVDVAGSLYLKQIQDIGSTPEALDIGDVGAGGWVFFRNIGANVARLHVGASDDIFATLNVGEVAAFRRGGTIKASSASGSTSLEYLVLPN